MLAFQAFNMSFHFNCYYVITTYDTGFSDIEHFSSWSEALSAFENENEKIDRTARIVSCSSFDPQLYFEYLESNVIKENLSK